MTNEIQFILYNLPDNEGSVQGVVQDETIWLTQKAMAQLFGVNVHAISKHLQNIYDSGELNKNATISKMETVVNRGFRGEVKEAVDRRMIKPLYPQTAKRYMRYAPIGASV